MWFDLFIDCAFAISSGHGAAALQEGPASAWGDQPAMAFVAQAQDR